MSGKDRMTLLVDGIPCAAKLTLGGLAEIEAALGVDTLMELSAKLANPSAHQILSILKIILEPIDGQGDVGKCSVNLRDALEVIAALFADLLGRPLPGKR